MYTNTFDYYPKIMQSCLEVVTFQERNSLNSTWACSAHRWEASFALDLLILDPFLETGFSIELIYS